MRSSASALAAVTPVALVAVIFAGGCQSDPNDVSFDAIKRDLTPEMMTLTERPIDVERNMAVTGNQNLRSFWNDLGRMWMTDHPSTLSPYNVYSTSGQPR